MIPRVFFIRSSTFGYGIKLRISKHSIRNKTLISLSIVYLGE